MPHSAAAMTPAVSASRDEGRHEWGRGWPVVLAALLGCMLMSIVVTSIGAFMVPIQTAFGWSRAQFSLGLGVAPLPSLVLPPLIGLMVDRFPPRIMAVLGSLVFGAVFCLFSTLTGSIPNWLMMWIILGVTGQFIFPTLWYAAVSSAFTASRGIALSIAMSGGALAGVFGPVMANGLIEAYGFRTAFVIMGASWGGLTALISVFGMPARKIRPPPPAGADQAPAGAPPALRGLTMKQGLRSSAFFKLLLINFVSYVVLIGLMIHLIPLLTDSGMSRDIAVLAASVFGLATAVGRLGAGFAVDRLPARFVGVAFICILGVGLVMLAMPKPSVPWAMAAAALAGLSFGGVGPVYPYLATRSFGMRNFGKLFGFLSCASGIATSVGPFVAGQVRDVTHSYAPFLFGALPALVLVIVLCLSFPAYPNFDEPTG